MLGIFDDPEIGIGKIRLAPGASLFVATDGVIDAERADGAEFGEQGIRRTLETCITGSATTIVETLFGAVNAFSAGAPQSDDITALVIRYLGD
jgi:sigma-B regulation protein RsbU (phosphoserine phosphatase)